MTGADVVVIGGGIQGLVLLRELSAAGYACALVPIPSLVAARRSIPTDW